MKFRLLRRNSNRPDFCLVLLCFLGGGSGVEGGTTEVVAQGGTGQKVKQ